MAARPHILHTNKRRDLCFFLARDEAAAVAGAEFPFARGAAPSSRKGTVMGSPVVLLSLFTIGFIICMGVFFVVFFMKKIKQTEEEIQKNPNAFKKGEAKAEE